MQDSSLASSDLAACFVCLLGFRSGSVEQSHTAAQPGLPSHSPCTQRGCSAGAAPGPGRARIPGILVPSCWDAAIPLELEQPQQVTDGSA